MTPVSLLSEALRQGGQDPLSMLLPTLGLVFIFMASLVSTKDNITSNNHDREWMGMDESKDTISRRK